MKLVMFNTCPQCGETSQSTMTALDGTSSREETHHTNLCIPCHYKQTCPHGRTIVQTCHDCGDNANYVANTRTPQVIDNKS